MNVFLNFKRFYGGISRVFHVWKSYNQQLELLLLLYPLYFILLFYYFS